MISNPQWYLLNPAVERRVIRIRRHWVMLLTVLLQTVGILIWAFALSRLINPTAKDVWLAESFL